MAEATIDQQFIEYIVKTLVGKPENVRIERKIDERGVLLELYVDAEDLGRVIGRSGATAKSIRTLLRALGVKNDARYNLKIVDTNGGGRSQDSDAPATQPVPPTAGQTDDKIEPAATSPDQPTSEPSQPEESFASAEEQPAAPTADAPAPSSDQPAVEPTAEPEAESDVARHRREIDDLTSGLDI